MFGHFSGVSFELVVGTLFGCFWVHFGTHFGAQNRAQKCIFRTISAPLGSIIDDSSTLLKHLSQIYLYILTITRFSFIAQEADFTTVPHFQGFLPSQISTVFA